MKTIRSILAALVLGAVAVYSLAAAIPASAAACTTGKIGFGSTHLSSDATTITISSIPSTGSGGACTWSNFYVSGITRSTYTTTCDDPMYAQFNGDTSGSYNYVLTWFYGSSGSFQGYHATRSHVAQINCDTRPAGAATGFDIELVQHSNTTFNKQVVGSNNMGYNTNSPNYGTMAEWHGSTWVNTSAVTQIDLFLDHGQFKSGSDFVTFIE